MYGDPKIVLKIIKNISFGKCFMAVRYGQWHIVKRKTYLHKNGYSTKLTKISSLNENITEWIRQIVKADTTIINNIKGKN